MSLRNNIPAGVNFPPQISVMLLPNWMVVVITNTPINHTRAKKFVQEKLRDKLVFRGLETKRGVYLYFYYVEHTEVEAIKLDEWLDQNLPKLPPKPGN